MPNKCTECDTGNTSESKFCRECGNQLRPPEEVPQATRSKEEAAIRQVVREVVGIYGKRDSKAMADICDETFMNLGDIYRGWESIEAFFRGFFKGMGDIQVSILEEIDLDFVTPDVAIYQMRGEFTNLPHGADGNPQPPQEWIAANVYAKRKGRWRRHGAFLTRI